MRISTDNLTVEKARDILDWMEDERCRFFLEQLSITESQLVERMLRSPEKDKEAMQILALRAFPAYHDLLVEFLKERVTQQDSK